MLTDPGRTVVSRRKAVTSVRVTGSSVTEVMKMVETVESAPARCKSREHYYDVRSGVLGLVVSTWPLGMDSPW